MRSPILSALAITFVVSLTAGLTACDDPPKPAAARKKLDLLRALEARPLTAPSELLRLHEALLFARAFPDSKAVLEAAEAAGAKFRFNAAVTEIPRRGGRVDGVVLEGGEHIAATVVVNVAGPHSFKINRMADVEGGMRIKTKALRHEVAHVPPPAGFDY